MKDCKLHSSDCTTISLKVAVHRNQDVDDTMLPLHIDSDLTVRVGGSTVRLTPSEGLQAAEQLIRKSTRRMMLDEALDAIEPCPAVNGLARTE
jgi:hypothetical protein